MSEDACEICGRPAGAGHEPRCYTEGVTPPNFGPLTDEQAHDIAQAAVRQYRSRWCFPVPNRKSEFVVPGVPQLQAAIVRGTGEHPGTDPYPTEDSK